VKYINPSRRISQIPRKKNNTSNNIPIRIIYWWYDLYINGIKIKTKTKKAKSIP